jgi:hypothetical protein
MTAETDSFKVRGSLSSSVLLFRHLLFSMFQRMNEDLAFAHSEAARGIDFCSGLFNLALLPHFAMPPGNENL